MLKKKAGDAWIALSVVACSVVLLIALALGLSGRSFVPNGQKLRVRFHDITGVQVSSQVKYAGAPAGTVSDIRMLTLEERTTSPANLVEVTLSLTPQVPPVTKNAVVSIASDTLLSDKFVLVSEEPQGGPTATMNDILQGISPTTFDELARNTNNAIEGLCRAFGSGNAEGVNTFVNQLQALLKRTESLMKDFEPAVQDARIFAGDARDLLSKNKARIQQTLDKLESTTSAMESLAKQSESLVQGNQKKIDQTIADLKVTSENLKVTSTYAKFLLQDLAQHPNRLIWGKGKSPALPSERKILESRQPIPIP